MLQAGNMSNSQSAGHPGAPSEEAAMEGGAEQNTAQQELIDTGANNMGASATLAEEAQDGSNIHAGRATTEEPLPTGSVDDDQNYQFYKEYCRLYYANIILTNRLSQLLNEKKDLQFKLTRLEVRISVNLFCPPPLIFSDCIATLTSLLFINQSNR